MSTGSDPSTANDQYQDQYGIRAAWLYRKGHPETLKILGLGPSAVDAAIKDGTLPPPAPLTNHGKAVGWMGWQLIEVVKARLARAPQRQANPPRPHDKYESVRAKAAKRKARKARERA